MQPHDIVEHLFADIGADALTQPGHEVEADERAKGHRRRDGDQQHDGIAKIVAGAAAEALVNQYLQAAAQG